ncbi:uncharacterized protein [Engystomops pustulosus]|uniref:uncharacterized protein n=1 Tax=Engystomops pustulosus TaxID=76066 RepID=UPI003AFAC80A
MGITGENLMVWPQSSPEFNPIGNLWSIIKQKIYEGGRPITSTQQLSEAILTSCKEIPTETLQKLTSSMDARIVKAHEVDDLLYEEVVLPESDVEFEQNQEESSEDESADGATAAVSTNPVSFQALLQRLREPIDEENRLNPWCFQDDPQWGPDEERPQLMEDTEGRLQNNQWCKCGSCKKMTTVEESICCCEFQAMDRLRHNITCVTQHPDFTSRIYSRDFLIELLQFSLRVTQRQFERQENRFLRWACYVKVTNLVYGFLGQGNRIPLPSCVVNKIRDIYPDPNATYTGFKWFPDYVFGDLPTNLNF